MSSYAEVKKIDIDKLKFFFDGEEINKLDSPSTLDLEGGECIDVYEKS